MASRSFNAQSNIDRSAEACYITKDVWKLMEKANHGSSRPNLVEKRWGRARAWLQQKARGSVDPNLEKKMQGDSELQELMQAQAQGDQEKVDEILTFLSDQSAKEVHRIAQLRSNKWKTTVEKAEFEYDMCFFSRVVTEPRAKPLAAALHEGKLLLDPQEVANAAKDQWARIWGAQDPVDRRKPFAQLLEKMPYIRLPEQQLEPIHIEEFVWLVRHLPKKKATGLDKWRNKELALLPNRVIAWLVAFLTKS